jgi:hypothetical protein
MNIAHLFLCVILACASCCGIYAQTTKSSSICRPITTPKGTINFDTVSNFAGTAKLNQNGIAVGTYNWQFSLCDPYFEIPGGKVCSPLSFLSEGTGTTPGCNVIFPNVNAIGYNVALDRVQFNYSSTSGQLSWLATLNCKCDESATTLKVPSGSYTAGQAPSGMITLDFEVASAGCCARVPTTTTPPATTSAENICKPIYNPGSIVPFLRPAALSGVFQNVTVEWDGATSLSTWQMNLCSPFNDAKGNVGFISEDNGQGTFPTSLARPSYDASTKSVNFAYSGQINTVGMNTMISCKCDPFSPSLLIPSNKIKVSQNPNSFLITAQIDATSPECCVVPNTGTTTFPPPPTTTTGNFSKRSIVHKMNKNN